MCQGFAGGEGLFTALTKPCPMLSSWTWLWETPWLQAGWCGASWGEPYELHDNSRSVLLKLLILIVYFRKVEISISSWTRGKSQPQSLCKYWGFGRMSLCQAASGREQARKALARWGNSCFSCLWTCPSRPHLAEVKAKHISAFQAWPLAWNRHDESEGRKD